jgi:type II secretory pathway pseudopilin PulG
VLTLPVCLLAVSLLTTAVLLAAETPAGSDALQQKTEEVERLKRELDRQEKELRRLQQENERLRKDQQKQERQQKQQQEQSQQEEVERLRQENERLRQEQPRPDRAAVVSPAAGELKPVTPIQNLPPLTAGAVVDVDELVGHFLTEPASAARRYADQTFRVKGAVDRFDRALVAREFSVILASPDRATAVKFKFNYVDQYHRVFTAKDGRELVARHAPGSETTLLIVGDTVVLGGRCHGLKDGTITFTKGEIVR